MNSIGPAQKTGIQDIDGILTGWRWSGSGLTYSFPTSGSDYGSNYGHGEAASGFSALNAAQQAAVRKIMSAYSSAANIDLKESSGSSADIRLAQSSLPTTAWAYELGTSNEGDVWINAGGTYANPVAGSYAYLTLLHEVGHTLGLKHGHENGGFGALSGSRDSLEYSVMTYRSYVGDESSDAYSVDPASYPQTPMMSDIAALQQLYGANYATRSGDTTYGWDPSTGEMIVDGVGQGAPNGNRVFDTVWDGGGRDTYDLSAYQNGVSIDLRPGQWSRTSNAQLPSLSRDDAHMAAGSIGNAFLYNNDPRSLVENAIGGAGDNLIIGNQADNRLAAGGGRDLIYGNLGLDVVYGNQGDDTLFGGQGGDSLFGGKDRDLVYGNLGDDRIYGNMGADELFGGAGADTIYGGQAEDLITGGLGDDLLVGGVGADTFMFRSGSGADLILGFDVGQGDRLALFGQSFDLRDDGRGGTLLSLSGSGTVDLAGVRPDALSGSAFT